MFSSLLFTGKCDRYVSNKSGTILRPFDVKILNHEKGRYAQLKNIWIRCCAYVNKKTSTTSNMAVVTLHVQFFICKWRTND